MRCPECGHRLVGVPDGSPCTECGTASSLAERDPGLMPSPGTLLLRFGWPSMAGFALLWVPALVVGTAVDGMAFFLILAAIVLMLLVGPLNSGLQSAKLMKRLPRRAREAPMLALIPRAVMIPLLAALATVPLNMALGFGACVGSIAITESVRKP